MKPVHIVEQQAARQSLDLPPSAVHCRSRSAQIPPSAPATRDSPAVNARNGAWLNSLRRAATEQAP
jgi:hypothetical protein